MADMIDIVMPAELEGTRAVVRSWYAAIGARVRANDPLVELETDKVTTEVPAPADGVVTEILLDSDADAGPGDVLGRMRVGEGAADPAADAKAEPARDPAASRPAAPVADGTREHRLSPSVRRALREHGLDPATIPGTGRDGRLTRADVDAHVARTGEASAQPAHQGKTTPAATGDRIVPHDRMRRLIADNMLASVTTAPHVTAVFEADFSRIIAHRAANRAAFAGRGVALTYTAYLVAASVAAMRAVPAINSRWHAEHLEWIDAVNIGVGTALGDQGLVVPVIQRAQDLSLLGIAERLQDLTARARAGKLTAADVRGGTFSISNHGVSGSLIAAPIIIQQPQSAILGVGKLEKRVVVREVDGIDTIQIRPMAFVSLTIDHRVVDGHQTNGWLTAFVHALEHWRDPN